MKKLLLMRHAKSSWGDESLPDFERPLNERGKRDALRVGRELPGRGAVPDVIASSTAVRALETTRLVCEALGASKFEVVQQEPLLYGAPSDRILEIVNLIPQACYCALLVGHNPGMQHLVTALTGELLPDGMKTAAVACIQLDVLDWSEVAEGDGTLEWVLYPGDAQFTERIKQ
jgi:phosphohistidine phosphatase